MAFFFDACCAASETKGEERYDSSQTSEYVAAPSMVAASQVYKEPGSPAKYPTGASPARTEQGSPLVVQEAKGSVDDGCFTVRINKETADTPLGCHLDISDGLTLRVCGIRPGVSPVQVHNDTTDASLPRIKCGDFITAVNGVHNNALKLGETIRSNKDLEITLRRPHVLSVPLNKGGGSLGLDLNYASKGTSLVIDKISDGAAEAWNQAHPDQAILRHDHIVSVNGVEGASTDLLALLGKSQQANIVIHRPNGS